MPLGDCQLCGQAIDPGSGAVSLNDQPTWIPFVEDLRSPDALLAHPACLVSERGLDALLDVIHAHDQKQRREMSRLLDAAERSRKPR